MEVIDIRDNYEYMKEYVRDNYEYMKEYVRCCYLEWSNKDMEILDYIDYKMKKINDEDNIISVLGLINDRELIGFISLFKYDGEEKRDLTPWYATMYVKNRYREKGYSKILNEAIQDTARSLGYKKIYLKSNLVNYYEKFEAKYMDKLKNGENLYYIDL